MHGLTKTFCQTFPSLCIYAWLTSIRNKRKRLINAKLLTSIDKHWQTTATLKTTEIFVESVCPRTSERAFQIPFSVFFSFVAKNNALSGMFTEAL